VIFLLALLVPPAAFSRVTVALIRILRFNFRMRNFFFDSLILSVTLPEAGTVKTFGPRRNRVVRLARTRFRLLKTALPVRPGVARKLNLNRRLRFTVILDLVLAKLAAAGVGATNVKRSATEEALVPASVITVTSTGPAADGGVTAVTWVFETVATLLAAAPPNLTSGCVTPAR
jgi:hypothetical protein